MAIATTSLDRRPARPADHGAESRALAGLMDVVAQASATASPAAPQAANGLLQRLAEILLDQRPARSAGVSVLEQERGRGLFRWRAAAGPWAALVSTSVPRPSSLCATLIERNTALLVARPEQADPALRFDPPAYEALLIPFLIAGEPAGAIWLVSHDETSLFDAEDLRLATNLGRFVASAYQLLIEREANERLAARLAAELSATRQIEAALQASQERYRNLFDSIDEGFCIVEVLFDAAERPIDYRFLEVNPAFTRQTGIENAVGRWMRDLAPQHEQHWFDIYGRIALTGEPTHRLSRLRPGVAVAQARRRLCRPYRG